MQEAGAGPAGTGLARTPRLAVALAGSAGWARLAPVVDNAVVGDAAVGDTTVIDIADPRAVPVTVNPLEPGPGQQVQAYADRLGGLFEAAFGPPDPVAAALRAGLRLAYAEGGWDLRTGWAPRTGRDPAVPSFRQFRLATLAAADELGYGRDTRAAVAGFLAARLDALWTGAAGHFLEGGHPVDLARLLAGADVTVAPLAAGGRASPAAVGGRTGLAAADGRTGSAAAAPFRPAAAPSGSSRSFAGCTRWNG